ncbi:MAG: beta-galactosidase, partial [Victivallaceae bacterium]
MKVSHRRPAALDQFYYGAAYYPEHWDRSMWENDARQMADAGFNAVRLGEFAWQLMEPEEGRYDFSLFDDAIEIIAAHGLKVIMCTPTAAPPRRLTATWPDMLRVDADGRPMLHGSRQHACHSSPRFRDYSRRITQAMADHFRDCHDVVGWQTDNEIHCHFSECHCPSCQSAFRHFLKAKYGSIDRLNRAWGTVFWSLTFDDFDQIETPRPNRPTFGNPSHELDYRRFLSCAAADFQRDQLEILRAAGRPWFTFHNGVMANLDYRGPFGQELDVLGFDVYPFFEFDPAKRRENHAFSLDRVRSLTGNFIIPEHQSGPGGQATYFHDNPEPGELRKLCYVSLARGGDSLLYFRWRTCRFGAEEYWCGVIDHDDVPRRRYREVAELGRDLATLGPWLRGTHVAIDCAVATGDYDSDTAHRLYPLGLPAPGVIA